MCLLALAWRCHRRYALVFAGNRDEFHDRPTAPAAWWPSRDGVPPMLAGRDLEAGGTWLGVRADGSFATVTNVREPGARRRGARSRGHLVTALLLAQGQALPWAPAVGDGARGMAAEAADPLMPSLRRVAAAGDDYAHFNLLAGRLGEPPQLGYVNNVDSGAECIAPGIHMLSNHRIDTPWPKAKRSADGLERLLANERLEDDALIEALLELLADRTPAADRELPDTGLERELERALSAPFIVTPGYGTRSTTVLLCGHDGTVTFVEQSFHADGSRGGRVQERFAIRATGPAS